MQEDLDKNKANLAGARHAALGLSKKIGKLSYPITLNSLVEVVKHEFNIVVAPAPKGAFSGKGDALSQIRGDIVFIIYDDEKSIVRKRFSVAHELGHLYLGHLHGNSSSDLNTDNFDEKEANAFAAQLLMPPIQLRQDIKLGLKDADKLAAKYNVSIDAMWWQLSSTGLINLMY